jgi:hypothetical protein
MCPGFGNDCLQGIRNIRIWVDVLESRMWFQVEKLAELVQRGHLPLSSLLDPQDFHMLQDIWDIVCAECACDACQQSFV